MTYSGSYALARVTVPVDPKGFRVQWSMLGRDTNGWRVLSSATQRSRYLACKAPRPVMRHLAGGCSRVGIRAPGLIRGPVAARRATPTELAAISVVGRRQIYGGHDSCVRYGAQISTIDPRYAVSSDTYRKPYGNCALGNGEVWWVRTAAGWRDAGEGSEGFPCDQAPPGVVRSLFGDCWTLTK